MKKNILKLYRFYFNINYVLFWIIQFILILIFTNFVFYTINILNPDLYNQFNDALLILGDSVSIVEGGIIFPIIETFIFQFLLYKLCKLMQIKTVLVSVLVASFIFGIIHIHPMHMITAFFSGCIYNFTYIFSIKKYKSISIAFCSVALLHITNNILALILD